MERAEITWSLMHPTELNVEYMKRVVREAENYRVDSFEICAACHTLLGGLDGLVLYEDFPEVAKSIDREGILANREKLREILAVAHDSGRPVYYWHREVTVWPEFLKAVPGLMDSNGEFDLLGKPFADLLRYKLSKAFEALPELDGIVLTLTEADFSAIHNSTPHVYPPEKVVEHIVRIFAEEHEKRGKHFILRSFGSIAQDYKDILAGAELASADHAFEVETKITPYDFVPFLPDNPFFCDIPNLTAGAECDSLGEFLSAGFLPAENVDHIVRYVRHAQKCGVKRYAIRLDRIGNSVFESCPINLYTYARAIDDPDVTADEIRKEYAARFYPASAASEMIELGKMGFDLVSKVHYINRNLIFHSFPPRPSLKWLKAGGYFALFAENKPLAPLEGVWSVQYKENSPTHAEIIAEKEEALRIAREGLERAKRIAPQLESEIGSRVVRLWSNGVMAAEALLCMTENTVDYVEFMMQGKTPDEFTAAVKQRGSLLAKQSVPQTAGFVNGEEHNVFPLKAVPVEEVYPQGIAGINQVLIEEYAAEFRARQLWAARSDFSDFILPGTICDDWRCTRNMHAAHGDIANGMPVRYVGNTVFPNGFLEFDLEGEGNRLELRGEGTINVEVDGIKKTLLMTAGKGVVIDLPATGKSKHRCKLTKSGSAYPAILGVTLLK